MRLSPNKIDYLAERILHLVEGHERIHVQTNSDLVFRAVADVIFDNMRTEEEIDAEVDEILEKHRMEIRAKEMDFGALRLKMKREIAKNRDFTL